MVDMGEVFVNSGDIQRLLERRHTRRDRRVARRTASESRRFETARSYMRRKTRNLACQNRALSIALALAVSDIPERQAAARQLAAVMGVSRLHGYIDRSSPDRLVRGLTEVWQEASVPMVVIRDTSGKFMSIDALDLPKRDDADLVAVGRGLPSDN